MVINEIFKYVDWIFFLFLFWGSDLVVNDDLMLNGDLVKIGLIVGFVQEVGGKLVFYIMGLIIVIVVCNIVNLLEFGWVLVVFMGVFVFLVIGWDVEVMGFGMLVFIVVVFGLICVILIILLNFDLFGVIVGQIMVGVLIV